MKEIWKPALALTLAVLLAFLWRSQSVSTRPFQEPPLLTVVIDCQPEQFKDRQRLAQLELELRQSPSFLGVMGPASCRLLVAHADPEAKTSVFMPRALVQLSDDDWFAVREPLSRQPWFVPRLFNKDLTQVVIRAVPKDASAWGVYEDIQKRYQSSFKGMTVYSRFLGQSSESQRQAVNGSFGVQALSARVLGKPGEFSDLQLLARLQAWVELLRRDPEVCSVVTATDAVAYIKDLVGRVDKPLSTQDLGQTTALMGTGLGPGLEAPCLSRDFSKISVVVSSRAEGEALRALRDRLLKGLRELAPGCRIEGLTGG